MLDQSKSCVIKEMGVFKIDFLEQILQAISVKAYGS